MKYFSNTRKMGVRRDSKFFLKGFCFFPLRENIFFLKGLKISLEGIFTKLLNCKDKCNVE